MDIIANLKAAIQAVQAQPEIDLSDWRHDKDCGTIFCVGGLCAVTPYFTEQGMYASHNYPLCEAYPFDCDDTLEYFFGNYGGGAYDYIFASAGHGVWDKELDDGRMTDKDLALARLAKALAIQEAKCAS